MIKKISSALVPAIILAILAGCSHTPSYPRYAAPEGVSTADLKNAISGATGRNESITVYVDEGNCANTQRKQLFQMRSGASDPVGTVKVAADQPLQLHYFEQASGNRTCNISLDVKLEAGKSYSLVGGFAYKSGLIPFLPGTRMCRFAVQDDADKSIVPRSPACPKQSKP